MSTKMHELLTSAVASREGALGEGHAFAHQHAAPVRRAIQARRIATHAGTGTVAAVASLGAVYGFHEWSAGALNPASSPSASAGETATVASPETKVTTTLVQVPIDESVYSPGETSRMYVYYASLGGVDMVPFPTSGIYYPGIADVSADAFIVRVSGDVEGYDIDGPGADSSNIGAFSVASDQGDLIGDRTHAKGAITWETIGHVSSTSEWGVRYFMLDGRLVSVADGESNPDAIEVVAMFEPPSGN